MGQQRSPVRPGVVWAGVAVALVGIIATGTALTASYGTFALLSTVVTAGGIGMSWAGGIIEEVQGSRPVRYQVRTPSGTGSSHAWLMTWSRRAAHTVTGSPATRVTTGASTLIASAAWLATSSAVLDYPGGTSVGGAVLRQTVAAYILLMCGLWLHEVGPSMAVATLAAGMGTYLLFASWLADIELTRVAATGIVTGVVAILAAEIAIWPRRAPGATSHQLARFGRRQGARGDDVSGDVIELDVPALREPTEHRERLIGA